MTFEELQKANELIQTMTIERYSRKTGKTTRKEYAEVNQRLKAFRSVYPEGQVLPELIKDDGTYVQFKVTITDNLGRILAVGHAEEKRGSSDINTTSPLENCETSATGRALGMCGFGIDTSIASFEEVSNAVAKQEGLKLASQKEKEGMMATIKSKAKDAGIAPDELLEIVLEYVGFDRDKQPDGITIAQYGKAMNYLNAQGNKSNKDSH